MTRLSLLLIGACAAAPAIAASPEERAQAQIDRMIAGRVAGKPVDCLPLTRSQSSSQARSTIAYKVAGTVYVNRFIGGCPELRDDRILVTRTPIGRTCRGDIAQVLLRAPNAIPVGACTFDYFTPYTKPR